MPTQEAKEKRTSAVRPEAVRPFTMGIPVWPEEGWPVTIGIPVWPGAGWPVTMGIPVWPGAGWPVTIGIPVWPPRVWPHVFLRSLLAKQSIERNSKFETDIVRAETPPEWGGWTGVGPDSVSRFFMTMIDWSSPICHPKTVCLMHFIHFGQKGEGPIFIFFWFFDSNIIFSKRFT